MITALCNVNLNSPVKLKLFRETFPSVYGVSDNWLIYFRGRYGKDAETFVRALDTAGHAVIFEGLNEECWALAVREMLARSRYDYLYIYIEDQFLVGGLELFKEVIDDAIKSGVEYFAYSFFNADMDFNAMEALYPEYSKHLAFFELSGKNRDGLKKSHRDLYPFSLVSVVAKNYFLKVLGREFYKSLVVPPFVQRLMARFGLGYPANRILLRAANRFLNAAGLRLVLYTPASPLNLEKSIHELDAELLPLRFGVVNREIFANFDDDNGAKTESMVKRGAYPKKLKADGAPPPAAGEPLRRYELRARETAARRFYQKSSRQAAIFVKYIRVDEGKIRISAASEEYILGRGESLSVYANVPHRLEGLEDSVYSVRIRPAETWAVGDYF